MRIEKRPTDIQNKYKIIQKTELNVPRTGPRYAYLLRNKNTDTYNLAYEEKTKHLRVLNLTKYLQVTEPEKYHERTEWECCYCSQYRKYQLTDEQPALDACYQCHRSIKQQFDKLLERIDKIELTAQTI
jgi:hypothetical protein